MSQASSVSAWLRFAHCHFPIEPSGPGIPVFICAVIARMPPSRRASQPISRSATWRRICGSFCMPRSLISAISCARSRETATAAPPPSPARSFISVVIATIQPLPSPPTRFSSGMKASWKKTSLNSASPVIWTSGRISTPSCSMSQMK
jgi:hypothetical protein